jgi:hypothetical protein
MSTSPIQTLTDELLGEIERDFSKLNCTAEFGPSVVRISSSICAIITELRTLRAENAELRKDAGRYRYLRLMRRQDIVVRDRVCHLFLNQLDTATDAAMQADQ